MNIEEKVNAIIEYILAGAEKEKENAIYKIYKLQNASIENHSHKNMEEEILSILCEIGMPENIKGHRYSAYAIKVAVENPDIMDAITGELYPTVADKFETTATGVERGIRYGIECAFDRCDFEVVEKYFGQTISLHRGKPTNSEFIARISNIVRRRIGNS